MMVNGYKCDREGCDAQGVTLPHETRPEGWVVVYGPTFRGSERSGTGSWHFCSWDCAGNVVTLLNRDDLPALAVLPGGAS